MRVFLRSCSGLLPGTVPLKLANAAMVPAAKASQVEFPRGTQAIFWPSNPGGIAGNIRLPPTTVSPDSEWRVPSITGPMIGHVDLIRGQKNHAPVLHGVDPARLTDQPGGAGSLLPSLIKTSEDEKTYASLQILK